MKWSLPAGGWWIGFGLAACATAPPEVEVVLGRDAPALLDSEVNLDLAARDARRLADEHPESIEHAIAASHALFLAANQRVQRGILAALEAEPPTSLDELLDAEDELPSAVKREVESLTAEGLDLARRALALAPDDPAARLHVALNLSLFTWSVGKTRALFDGLVGDSVDAMAAALEADPAIDGAAPLRLRGRFLSRAPWPYGDDEAAVLLLRRATELAPVALNHLFLGDALHETGDAVGALREWRTALDAVQGETSSPIVELYRSLANWRCRLAGDTAR